MQALRAARAPGFQGDAMSVRLPKKRPRLCNMCGVWVRHHVTQHCLCFQAPRVMTPPPPPTGGIAPKAATKRSFAAPRFSNLNGIGPLRRVWRVARQGSHAARRRTSSSEAHVQRVGGHLHAPAERRGFAPAGSWRGPVTRRGCEVRSVRSHRREKPACPSPAVCGV